MQSSAVSPTCRRSRYTLLKADAEVYGDRQADLEMPVEDCRGDCGALALTSSLWETTRYIRLPSVVGSPERWRGAGLAIVRALTHSWVVKVLLSTLAALVLGYTPSIVVLLYTPSIVVPVSSSVLLLMRAHLLGTHGSIGSSPSPSSSLSSSPSRLVHLDTPALLSVVEGIFAETHNKC
ncbi:hypothetical protein B0H16DRAFT_1880940 [Mycena metata]|uniref:Uncharacterized protein n=1 Tax=Mycena metata TaxID=1033252 RepID=A0AAD7JUU2_9AGAR|nr:hypothetical protein B0H16DRAFT_1880940 [Mycena metata]